MTVQKDSEGNEARHLHQYANFTGQHVLEVGCGDGRLTWKYARSARHVAAIDLERDDLRLAIIDRPAGLEKRVDVAQANAIHLPFRKSAFGRAIMAWSLCCIEHEGMLQALEEVRRVLAVGGVLIDLRPVADRWPIELMSVRSGTEVARVSDLAPGLADDAAANAAMQAVERAGLFRRDRQELFAFRYSWDSPREMQECVEDEWAGVIEVDEGAWSRIRSAWAIADADARVGIQVQLLITRWLKAK